MDWQAVPPAEVISTPSKVTYVPPERIHALDMEYQNRRNPKTNGSNKEHKFLEEPAESDEKPTVGQVLKTFLSERLSAHAIPRIFKSPSVFRQVIWTFVSLLFLGLLMWQVTDTVKAYLDYPKTTTIKVKDATWVRFPAVTVCSLNALVKAKACNTRWKSAVTVSDENACGGSSEGTGSTASPQDSEISPARRQKRSPSEMSGSSYSAYPFSYSSYSYGSYPGYYYSSSEDSDHGESSYQSDSEYSAHSDGYFYSSAENSDELFSSVSNSFSTTAEYSYSSYYSSSEHYNHFSDGSYSYTTQPGIEEITTPDAAATAGTNSEQSSSPETVSTTQVTSNVPVTISTSLTTQAAESTTTTVPPVTTPLTTTVLSTSPQTTTETAQTTTEAAQTTTTLISTEEATTTEDTTYAPTTPQPDTTFSGTSESFLEAGNSSSTTEFNDTSTSASWTGEKYSYDEDEYYYDYEYGYAKVDHLMQNQFHNLSIDNFEEILEAMQTSDGSQIAMVFTPSKEEILEAGITGEQFIIGCSYNSEACSYKDFLQWQSGVYGNCFTFNSVFEPMLENGIITKTSGKEYLNKTRKTTHVGARYGLRLMLNISEEDVITSLSPNIGARVSIHHPQSVPFPEDHGLNIQPETSTAIGISTTMVLRRSYPYGNCSKNDEWNQENIGSYTSDVCVNSCLENRVRERCGCISDLNTILDHSFHEATRLPRCNPTNATQDECFATVTSKYLKNEETCGCPPACNETSYAVTSSFNEINWKFFNLMAEKKHTRLPEKPITLHIYMDTLSTSVVAESPSYTWFTLISNIGGLFGLFVGLSLVTIVEVLEFMVDFIAMFAWQVVCCHACKRPKQTTKVMPK